MSTGAKNSTGGYERVWPRRAACGLGALAAQPDFELRHTAARNSSNACQCSGRWVPSSLKSVALIVTSNAPSRLATAAINPSSSAAPGFLSVLPV